jgi:hypothetical protein
MMVTVLLGGSVTAGVPLPESSLPSRDWPVPCWRAAGGAFSGLALETAAISTGAVATGSPPPKRILDEHCPSDKGNGQGAQRRGHKLQER